MDSKVINASEIERTNGEATLHRFLVLLVADVVQQKASTRVGAVLLQKILFQVRRSLQRLRHPDLSMGFVRYHYGPYSFTVANDEHFLKEAGLLTATGVTPRGEAVLKAFRRPVTAAIPQVVKTVIAEAEKRATWSADRAKKEVYALKVRLNEKVLSMKDVPMGTPFFSATPAIDLPAHLLLDLSVAMSHPSRREAGRRFKGTAEAMALLS